MRKFKKIKNDPLQIIGSIMTVLGIWFIVYPVFKSLLYSSDVDFSFFGILNGYPALIACIVLLVIGLIFVMITQPLVKKQKRLKDIEKKK